MHGIFQETTNTIILKNNSKEPTFFEEPFSASLFIQYLNHTAPNKSARLIHYLKSKWRPLWLKLKPSPNNSNLKELERLDEHVVEEGFKLAFPNGISNKDFKKNTETLEKSILLASTNGINTTLVQTPTLFNEWPGQNRFNNYCDSLNKFNVVSYLDFSNEINDPRFFYDHHHLNTAGITTILPKLNDVMEKIKSTR